MSWEHMQENESLFWYCLLANKHANTKRARLDIMCVHCNVQYLCYSFHIVPWFVLTSNLVDHHITPFIMSIFLPTWRLFIERLLRILTDNTAFLCFFLFRIISPVLPSIFPFMHDCWPHLNRKLWTFIIYNKSNSKWSQ